MAALTCMAMPEMLMEVMLSIELFNLIPFAKLVNSVQMLHPLLLIRLREVGELITTVTTYITRVS